MLDDKKELILYLLDKLVCEYEKKLACLTKEMLRPNCEHEKLLMAEKRNIISALESITNAIDDIQIVEGVINIEENSRIQGA